MVSSAQIIKTQTCFLQEMVQNERIQPGTVDLIHLGPICLCLMATMCTCARTCTCTCTCRWGPAGVEAGLPWRLLGLQGTRRTWVVGAAASFETIESVIGYNLLLLRGLDTQMAAV